jgi:alpha-ketoglutarate-dependent taurine dioxygenase
MDVTTTTEPRANNLPMGNLVTESTLAPNEVVPLIIQPTAPGLQLLGWTRDNRDYLHGKLLKHGALLFRGFELAGIPEFETWASTLVKGDLFGEYNDLPHEQGKVYGTTPYPPDKAILFHNESSHMHRWNAHQFFYCIQPSQTGGRTPILDCREAYRVLDPKIVELFETKGLLYVRNFVDGFDVPWQQFFHTDEKAKVEAYCAEHKITAEWKKGGGLRLKQKAPGVITHPETHEKLFFNQVQLHHISCVDPKVRKSLQMLFKPDDLPRNVYYGDGSPIPDETMAEIDRVYWKIAKLFDWAPRDVVAIDNMIVSHARLPYTGPRKIVVAMGDLIYQKDFFVH